VTTTNKDFRVKNGLIVEGNSATVNGNQVITTSDTQTLTNKTLTTPKINENVDLTATSTELNYVDGVTSAIQTQIDAKAPLASPTFTGTVTIPANSAITGVPYLATANTFTGGVQQITTANAETVGLIVKGTESQTANLQEWHNFDGTVRASLRNTGALNLGTLITGTQLSVIPINNTTTGIVVKGVTSQSNDLQQWQNNAGTTLASIQAGGNLRISGSMGYVGGGGSQLVFQSGNNSAYFAVTSTAGSYPSLQVIGISTQTSDLQQWRGSAGTVLSGINSAGQIYAGTTTSINGSTTTAITSAAYTSATVAVFTYGGTSLVQAGQRVTVASVSGGTYNGTWTVTAVTSTTFTVLGSGFTDVAGTGGTFTLSAVGSFVAGTAAITPIVVRGATSQTANLQQWQDSAGSAVAYMSSSGVLNTAANYAPFYQPAGGGGSYLSMTSGSPVTAITLSASVVPFAVKGAASQSASLQEWQNSSGSVLTSVGADGRLYVNNTINVSFVQNAAANGPYFSFSSSNITANALSSTNIPLIIKGAASQTANLQEWQNSSGTVMASMDASGKLIVPTLRGPAGSVITLGVDGNPYSLSISATQFDSYGPVPWRPYNTSMVGFIVKGLASQTANLQEWQNSSGTILANVSSSGEFTVPSLTVSGNFTVNGTTTNINSTNLVVEDKNIILGDVETPTDITADGGGITLKGTTDKTFNWVDSTDSWTSSEHINLASGKSYSMNGTALKDVSETLTNKTLTSPTIDTPLLTLSTTSSTTDGRIAWDSTNDKILVGGTLNSVSQAVEFASSTLTISTPTFTTNAYTVVLADKDKWLELSNGATAGTLNIPTDATANFAIGSQINILQTGAGQITIAAVTPATTTVNGSPGLKLRGQWSVATIVKRAANTWVAVGDLSA
jgi:hypothetical protein